MVRLVMKVLVTINMHLTSATRLIMFGGPETGDQLGLGAIQRAYSNPNIVWETNVSKNIGLDASLLRGALSLSF